MTIELASSKTDDWQHLRLPQANEVIYFVNKKSCVFYAAVTDFLT
jgi:hypothetical protein